MTGTEAFVLLCLGFFFALIAWLAYLRGKS